MGRRKGEDEHGDPAEKPDRKRRKIDDEVESIVPMDVLLLIFARLTAVDLIRSGAVCVSWRSAVKTWASPRTIRPWLTLPEDVKDHRARFLDTTTGRYYGIHLPELHQKRLVGMSDHGFLVYEDELSKRLSMINPITRAAFRFPPLPRRHRGVSQVFVVSSSSPSSSGTGYTAVIHRAGGMFSAFVDAGNVKTWGRVSSILDDVKDFGLHVYRNKLCGFFTDIRRRGAMFFRLFTCDLHDPAHFKVWDFKFYDNPWSLSDFGGSFPDHERDDCEDLNDCLTYCCETMYYPVFLPNRDLIVVCRAVVNYPETAFVKVYRMPTDLHGDVEVVTSIGNCALFLDEHRSIVLSTLEFPELKPGSIYFNDDCHLIDSPDASWSPFKGLVMFDLEAQRIVEYLPISMKELDCSWATWFVPAF